MPKFATMEENYTPKYCLQLEAAYGKDLMSEGGGDGIEFMFEGVPLENKTALDIGSGLGGVAFYLAEKYNMKVTGLEVNGWMVGEAAKRTPPRLKDKVFFFQSTGNSRWPIADKSFDLVYSKEVLSHLQNKEEMFLECRRLLKPGGHLIITDWLSSDHKKWGKHIERLVELEHLELHPENEKGYFDLLKKAGFKNITSRDDSLRYIKYNQEIIDRLNKGSFDCFTKDELKAAVEGYLSILKALETKEMRIVRFTAER